MTLHGPTRSELFGLMDDSPESVFTLGSADFVFDSKRWMRTWIFDPPYNIGFRYSSGTNDRMSVEDYHSFIEGSVKNMRVFSKKDANLFLVIYPEAAARLLPVIERSGWKLKQWLSWVYPSNIGMSHNKATTAHRAILWFTIGIPPSYMKSVQQPYRNPKDKRIQKRIAEGAAGVNLYDWWEVNLRKNVSKGFKGYYNQLPTEIVRRMILLTTEEGEWVGDLTAGAGTTWEVAKPLNRNCWLNDTNEECLAIWEGI